MDNIYSEENSRANWSCVKIPEQEDELKFAGCDYYIRQQFTDYFREFIVNLSLAEFVCRTLQPAEASGDVAKLKEIYDGLNLAEEDLTPPEHNEPSEHKIEKKEEIKTEPQHRKEEGKAKSFNARAEFLTYQLLKNYNIHFIKQWQFTINYRIWELTHFPRLFCFSEYSSNFVHKYVLEIPVSTTVYYDNGDTYMGDIMQGKRWGNGTLSYDKGKSVYEGEWVNDKRNGKGKQVSKEGSYSGSFVEYLWC
eukprot:TRINITY_DN4014_c0_g1_i13.p1 TRINITY_DN4014_c0_g1~~TRINITY_DN4014_c0_g1_i13.p1  ORF type:complete len:250 (+),score=62.65 TRINITY_DN4014_c0_g1_i13:261-1010(+)